jgi:NADH-dependent peroxiredoxin subunit F
MYDLIIVGAGPAGITAAVYAARKRLNTLVLSRDIGGQAALSWDIENYTGYQFISGPELAKKFEEHLGHPGIASKVGAASEATRIVRGEGSFKVKTQSAEYEGKAVIIATGRKPRLLRAKGEDEYRNKGVSYCATCDGPLFSGKDVAVVGGGNAALDAVVQLIAIAEKVYLIDIGERIVGDRALLERAKASGKVEVLERTEVREIFGGRFVEGIKVLVEKHQERTIPVGGVFIQIGSMPAGDLGALARTNERGEIAVSPDCATSVPGLFAAGDVTDVPEKQIIVAAGQGCIAALSAFKYLSRK